MDLVAEILKYKQPNREKLQKLGFVLRDSDFTKEYRLNDSGFLLELRLTPDNALHTRVCDPITQDEYRLHLSQEAIGSFVGTVRSEFADILEHVVQAGYDVQVFSQPTSRALIDHVRATYGHELEYLWQQQSGNAIWRRTDTKKWYGVMALISKRKLGLDSDDLVEVLNLSLDPVEVVQVIDHLHIFPGWHMNKKYWVSVLLDGTVPLEEIIDLLRQSYARAGRR